MAEQSKSNDISSLPLFHGRLLRLSTGGAPEMYIRIDHSDSAGQRLPYIAYADMKKRLSEVGRADDGKTEWRFEPGDLNEGFPFWHEDYLDPFDFVTARRSVRDAATVAAAANGLRIIYQTWNSRRH